MILALLVSSNIPVFAANKSIEYASNTYASDQTLMDSLLNESSDMEEQFPEIREINRNTIKLLKQGYGTKEILDKISDKDYRTLLSIYKEVDSNSINTNDSMSEEINDFLTSNGVSIDYIEEIEALAEYYQEYYEKYSKFPDEPSSEFTNIEIMSTTYDPILFSLGYYVTATTLAQQLATLGTICSATFPYLALIALLAGVTVLSPVMYDYVDNLVAIEGSVTGWYSGSRNNIKYSGSTTAALVTYRILYNIKYWRAHLVNFAGLGGIAVSTPMTEGEAVAWLSVNNANNNTYSIYITDAANVAQKTGNANPYMDQAHRGGGQILNMPHFHPVKNGQRMKSHCFYGFF